LVGRHRREL
jgi:hypothetical protein